MAATKTYRVLPKDGEWQVKALNASRASSRHPTKPEAIAKARQFGQRPGTVKVVIHRKDGTVQESRTYD